MQYSLSSSSTKQRMTDAFVRTMTWLMRFGVGATFIFSGFVKAVDPWGTFYKMEEYAAALGVPMLPTLLLCATFALCATEFITGVCLVLGCYRRSSPIVALCFMCVMLPLTLWIAVSDPVKDCGCFGDYLVLSNWATFWKNVILTLMTIWLVRFNRDEITIISPAFQWIQVVFSLAFVGAVSLHGYFTQPLLDFRPYPAGTVLGHRGGSEDESESDDFLFVYEKDGVRKTFGVDDELPDEADGWNFVERLEKSPNSGESNDESTFRIWNRDGDTDYTDMVLDNSGRMLLLLIPDLKTVSPATTWRINSLYDWSEAHGVDMVAVVSGSASQIQEWEDLSMPRYDIYTADDTAIKEVARGNPAVVSLNDGVVEWKSTLSALDVDEITSHNDAGSLSELKNDDSRKLLNWFYIYLASLASLIVVSMLPRIKNAYGQAKMRHNRRDVSDAH